MLFSTHLDENTLRPYQLEMEISVPTVPFPRPFFKITFHPVPATPAVKCAVKHQQLYIGLKIEKILFS